MIKKKILGKNSAHDYSLRLVHALFRKKRERERESKENKFYSIVAVQIANIFLNYKKNSVSKLCKHKKNRRIFQVKKINASSES